VKPVSWAFVVLALSAAVALVTFRSSGFSAVLAGINVVVYGTAVGWAIGRKVGSNAIVRDAFGASVVVGYLGAVGLLAASRSQATLVAPRNVLVPAALLGGFLLMNLAPLYAYVRSLIARNTGRSM
jgi:hypothetical protein